MKEKIKGLLERGVKEGVFPGAVLLVAWGSEVVFHGATGFSSLTPKREKMEKSTIFDLASLTKPLATALAMMKLVGDGKVGLDQPLSDFLEGFSLRDKARVTPRLLLSHSAGFRDWKPFFLELEKNAREERKGVLRKKIVDEPLVYTPGEESLYSDLGFMVLEWVIEERAGESLPRYLDRYFYGPLALKRTGFIASHENGNPPRSLFTKGGGQSTAYKSEVGEGEGVLKKRDDVPYPRELFAATEDCPWRKRVIQGEVHDENAFVVGGYSGHAGLFGVAEEVYRVVNLLREHYHGNRRDYFDPKTVREFFRRQEIVDGCTWALGWDTPSQKDSSAGRHFSPESVGHLGYTGTSIWMDIERDIIVIFLTNRVHPTRNNEKIRAFRPLLHDTIIEGLFK